MIGLVAEVGLKLEASDEVKYSFEYPDLATAVRAGSTSAASVRAARLLGEGRFGEVLEGAFKAFEKPDGHVRLANTMLYVVARK